MNLPIGNLGPCNAYFKGVLTGYNLNVVARMTDETAPVHLAQFGTASYDDIITGRVIEVEMDLADSTLAQLEAVMPATTLTVDELMISTPVGTSLRDNGGILELRPFTDGAESADPDDYLTYFLASPYNVSEWTFDADTQRVTHAMFRCFEVDTVASGESYSSGDFGAIGYGENT